MYWRALVCRAVAQWTRSPKRKSCEACAAVQKLQTWYKKYEVCTLERTSNVTLYCQVQASHRGSQLQRLWALRVGWLLKHTFVHFEVSGFKRIVWCFARHKEIRGSDLDRTNLKSRFVFSYSMADNVVSEALLKKATLLYRIIFDCSILASCRCF